MHVSMLAIDKNSLRPRPSWCTLVQAKVMTLLQAAMGGAKLEDWSLSSECLAKRQG
jgi:hypothetical protein